jgi:hypothetical protein
MKKLLLTLLACTTSLLTLNAATPDDYAWTVSLGGTGSTVTVDDHDTSVGADLSVGHTGKLLLPVEVGVRQGVSYDSTAVYSTRLYSDWTLFSVAKNTLDVFVGANVGVVYGDVQTAWTAAPETGLRWWVKNDVAVLVRAEAPFQLDSGAEFTDSVKYFLGFQIRF